jgi:2-polyprenyl-3-methyl-5-hydroxy-6-metoxy-1,4-benzoquinol methylase
MAEPQVDRSSTEVAAHWDAVHGSRALDTVSWYEPSPRMSLRMLDALEVTPGQSVVDVGGGAAALAIALAERGFADVTTIDISAVALDLARHRRPGLQAVLEDVLSWRPPRRFDVWHDRAVFHFLVTADERARYRDTLAAALSPGGAVVVGVFATNGPPTCSGLPVVRYHAAGLTRELGADFTVIAEERDIHVTPAGKRQPFTWLALRHSG